METIITGLPKTELHIHLRGAMPISTFSQLAGKYPPYQVWATIPPERQSLLSKYENIRAFSQTHDNDPQTIATLFRFTSFEQFLATYLFTVFFIREAQDLASLVQGVVASLQSQRVVYAEITISVGEYLNQGITLAEIKSCLENAGTGSEIRIQWLVDLVRNYGPESTMKLLQQIIRLDCDSIVGITLGGSEHLFPPAQFKAVYHLAREQGLRLSVHAGEALGPSSIWDALQILQVERIGHGVRAVEDPRLVEYLAQHQIPLEVCPTSNLLTGIYPSRQVHPLAQLLEAGCVVTLNSDDPTFFATDLNREYIQSYQAGIPQEQILRMMENGFSYAFLPEADRQRYLQEFRTVSSLMLTGPD